MSKQTTHTVRVINRETSEIIKSKSTGKMYDSWIKACQIREELENEYSGIWFDIKVVEG